MGKMPHFIGDLDDCRDNLRNSQSMFLVVRIIQTKHTIQSLISQQKNFLNFFKKPVDNSDTL